MSAEEIDRLLVASHDAERCQMCQAQLSQQEVEEA